MKPYIQVENVLLIPFEIMEYVHQIIHRTRSNKINNYKIVHQDGSQGRTNDLMNTPENMAEKNICTHQLKILKMVLKK